MKNNFSSLFCVLLSGLLAGFSFPVLWGNFTFNAGGWFAWIAFVPLLFISKKKNSSKKIFCLGGLAGLVFYSISLSWFYLTLPNIKSLSTIPGALGVTLIILFLSTLLGIHLAITHFLERRIRWGQVLIFPTVGVSIAYILNYFPFGGFPWGNFAYTQWKWLSFIQVLDLVGVYGLLFLIFLVNSLAANFLYHLVCRNFRQSLVSALTIAALLFLPSLYGSLRMKNVTAAEKLLPSKRVAIVQANIPQEKKFEIEARESIIKKYRRMTYETGARKADLIVWAETSSPVNVPRNMSHLPGWFGEARVPLLFGTFSYGLSEPKNYWNSAFLVDSANRVIGRYDKVHRVPFGEYVPFPLQFIFKEPVTGGDSIQAGEQSVLLKTEEMDLGVLICFEDLFPELARHAVKKGAELLVLMTNDAWHGYSSAPFQHLLFSIYRAIENRISVVRAANTGISAIIDPVGNIKDKTQLFTEETVVQEVGIGSIASPYTLLGDWSGWLSLFSFGGLIFRVFI